MKSWKTLVVVMTVVAVGIAFTVPAVSHQIDPAKEKSPEAAADTAAETKAKPARVKIPKEIIFESPTGDVMFPHRAHMKQKCATCHHQIRAKAIHSPHEDYMQSTWIFACKLDMKREFNSAPLILSVKTF